MKKEKNLKKANEGPVPQKNFKSNKGKEPNLGDEGGVPGNYFKKEPSKRKNKKK